MAVTLRSGHATGTKAPRSPHKRRRGLRPAPREPPAPQQLPLPKPEHLDDDEDLDVKCPVDDALSTNPDYIALVLARRVLEGTCHDLRRQMVKLSEWLAQVARAQLKREVLAVYREVLSRAPAPALVMTLPRVHWDRYSAALGARVGAGALDDPVEPLVEFKRIQMFKR